MVTAPKVSHCFRCEKYIRCLTYLRLLNYNKINEHKTNYFCGLKEITPNQLRQNSRLRRALL